MSRAAISPAASSVAVQPPVSWMGDASYALRTLALLPVAWLVPERRWQGLCRWVSRALQPPERQQVVEAVHRATAAMPELPAADEILLEVFANRLEQNLQTLRELRPGRWRPRVHLTGAEHLERALERGRGAILWVAPQMLNKLLVKKVIAEAGFRFAHLSHPGHGPRKSRLINRLWVSRENRYVTERITIPFRAQFTASRRLERLLRAGHAVSITCIPPRHDPREYPCLGNTMRISTGPPNLALATGAALLPVVSVRSNGAYEVVIDPPLELPQTENRRAAASALADQYARRVVPHLERDPVDVSWWVLVDR